MGKRGISGPGAIYHRKDGRYEIRIPIPGSGGKQKSVYCANESDAKRKLKELQRKYYRGEFITMPVQSTEDFMKDWLYHRKQNELKPTSFDRLEETLLYQVLPEIGMIQVQYLNSDDIQRLINKLKDRGYSYSTVKKAFQCVNNCFRNAVLSRKLEHNPTDGVIFPRKEYFSSKRDPMEEEDFKYFTEAESKQLTLAATQRFPNGALQYRLGYVVPFVLNMIHFAAIEMQISCKTSTIFIA